MSKSKIYEVSGNDGKAIIHSDVGHDGVVEYWLHTEDFSGNNHGPYSTPEVFTDFAVLKKKANDIVTEMWVPAIKLS